MAIQNRNTTLPGIWAENAQTTIPTPPVAGVTYRDTTLNSTAIDKAWPFKTIVDSSDFNQHAFLQDTLIKEAEQYGIMRWNNTTTYKEGGFCLGQDGKIYQALRDNQGKEPTSSTDDWKANFVLAQEFMTALAGKANVDMSNIDASGKEFISTQSLSSSRFDNLTLGASGSKYTAPANGCFKMDIKVKNTNANAWGENGKWFDGRHANSGYLQWTTPRCKKGDVFSILYQGLDNSQVKTFAFIYDEGAK